MEDKLLRRDLFAGFVLTFLTVEWTRPLLRVLTHTELGSSAKQTRLLLSLALWILVIYLWRLIVPRALPDPVNRKRMLFEISILYAIFAGGLLVIETMFLLLANPPRAEPKAFDWLRHLLPVPFTVLSTLCQLGCLGLFLTHWQSRRRGRGKH